MKGYLVIRGKDGAKSYSGTQYINPDKGTRRLCLRTGTGPNDIVKYGLTTNTSASAYCGMKLRVDGNVAYIGRSEQGGGDGSGVVYSSTTSSSLSTTSLNAYSYSHYLNSASSTKSIASSIESFSGTQSASGTLFITSGTYSETISGGTKFSTISQVMTAKETLKYTYRTTYASRTSGVTMRSYTSSCSESRLISRTYAGTTSYNYSWAQSNNFNI